MSATDEFRRLLDERGVKWENVKREIRPRWFIAETAFSVSGTRMSYVEYVDNSFLICNDMNITPEQAIAATLGPGTCHNVDIGTEGYFKCSECGTSCSVDWEESGWDEPNFCPNCGRKVVGE